MNDINSITEEVKVTGRCLNCGSELDSGDAYCRHCGQQASTARLQTKSYLQDMLTDMSRINRGALLTAFNLLWHPWYVATEYIEGHRTRWCGPMKMLIILVFCYVVLDGFFHYGISTQEPMLDDDTRSLGPLMSYGLNFLDHSPVLLYVLMFLPIAPMISWSTAKQPPWLRLNMAEGIVYALYLGDSMMLLEIINMPSAVTIGYFMVMTTVSLWRQLSRHAATTGSKVLRIMKFWGLSALCYLALFLCFVLLVIVLAFPYMV